MQNLGLCLLELVFFIPNLGLQLHCATKIVGGIDRVRFGAFDVSMRVVEPLFAEKQLRQRMINPKQEMAPAERGRDPEGRLVVVDRLLRLAPRTSYVPKDMVTFTDQKLIPFVREEINCSECGFFCGVELLVIIQ